MEKHMALCELVDGYINGGLSIGEFHRMDNLLGLVGKQLGLNKSATLDRITAEVMAA